LPSARLARIDFAAASLAEAAHFGKAAALRIAAEKAAFVIVTLEIKFFAVRRIIGALVLVHATVFVSLKAAVASAFSDVVGNPTALLAI